MTIEMTTLSKRANRDESLVDINMHSVEAIDLFVPLLSDVSRSGPQKAFIKILLPHGKT